MRSTTKRAIKEAVETARKLRVNDKTNEAYFLLYETIYYWFDCLGINPTKDKKLNEQSKRELIIEATEKARGML